MASLILLFIFVTPHLWDYGDKPSRAAGPSHPIQVTGDGGRGIIVTVAASDVDVPQTASDNDVRKILRKAIEPVTGDAVSVTRWETRRTRRATRYGRSGPTADISSSGIVRNAINGWFVPCISPSNGKRKLCHWEINL